MSFLAAVIVCSLLDRGSATPAPEFGLVWAAEAVNEAAAPAASAAGRSDAPAAKVEEAEPSLYYLKDKQGGLQAVPNFSFEDFEELYRLKHQLVEGDQRPRYSIQQISATGAVVGEHAELTIQFHILARDDQWVRVPLHLDQALLREPPHEEGPGEQFLHFEGDGEGYVLWMRGSGGKPHQLRLKMLVPLTTSVKKRACGCWCRERPLRS